MAYETYQDAIDALEIAKIRTTVKMSPYQELFNGTLDTCKKYLEELRARESKYGTQVTGHGTRLV